MKSHSFRVRKGRYMLCGAVQEIGSDLLISIWGGNRPHIGAVGIAVPRPSLKDPKRWSATSSGFTFLGHKEDSLVKTVSEKIAGRLRKNVVVTAGAHWDKIDQSGIETVNDLADEMADRLIRTLMRAKAGKDVSNPRRTPFLGRQIQAKRVQAQPSSFQESKK